jgi:predicted O-methyltransferase YrrM
MTALAIALQGVGYPTLVTALQGLVEFAETEASGGGGPRVPNARRMGKPIRRAEATTGEEAEPRPLEIMAGAVGTTQPKRAAEATGAIGAASAQMLRAELAQIETRAREREAQFAALQAQMSADAEAAERAALLAARKRDNNRRAQILVALLMLN